MNQNSNQSGTQQAKGSNTQIQSYLTKYLKNNPQVSEQIVKSIPSDAGFSGSDFQKWISESH